MQVLFCRLTDEQRDLYKIYLTTRDCREVLSKRDSGSRFQIDSLEPTSEVRAHHLGSTRSRERRFAALARSRRGKVSIMDRASVSTGDLGGSPLLRALMNLRKICNHPHLVHLNRSTYSSSPSSSSSSTLSPRISDGAGAHQKPTGRANSANNFELAEATCPEGREFTDWRCSGKMLVLDTLLAIWFKQHHRVLLFSQGTQVSVFILF